MGSCQSCHGQEACQAPDECLELPQLRSWDEKTKLDSLRALGVLGKPPARLESAMSILRSVFGVEVAAVSLLAAEELALVSRSGGWPARAPAQGTLAEWMLALSPPLVALTFPGGVVAYEDLAEDPRFVDSPFVRGPPGLRFWAGMPLLSPSRSPQRLGSLCILDFKPRRFEATQYAVLQHVAEVVVKELEAEAPSSFSGAAVAAAVVAAASAAAAATAPPLRGPVLPQLSTDRGAPGAVGDAAGAGAAAAAAGAAAVAGAGEVRAAVDADQEGGQEGNGKELNHCSSASFTSTSRAPPQWASSLSRLRASRDSVQGTASTQSTMLATFHQMRPKVFEEVKLGPLVGKGSNGRCYKAVWQGGHVVVKIIDCLVPRDQLLQDPHTQVAASSKGAVVEAVLGRSLAHPHIVSTFDWAVATEPPSGYGERAGSVRQQVWIIQAYCNRGTLMEAIERGDLKDASDQPSLTPILRTAQEIAGAMATLHQHDVLHSDLTCHNILLTSSNKDARRWIPQISDFGLSRMIKSSIISTESLGTVTHMPPELLTEGLLTPAADVYSFGVILWELWMGHRAWKGYNAAQTLHAVCSGKERLAPLPTAPPAYQELVERCLQHDRLRRPSFDSVLSAITELIQSLRNGSLN